MFVLSVSIHVKPEHVEQFIPAMLANARGSRAEQCYDLVGTHRRSCCFRRVSIPAVPTPSRTRHPQ